MRDTMAEPEEKPRPLTLAWFKPLYRRLILVALVAVWCGVEWLYNGDQMWGMLTLAALAYAVWVFIINFEKELARSEGKGPGREVLEDGP
jgi:hypothetical protein